jgi:hypothetical protein
MTASAHKGAIGGVGQKTPVVRQPFRPYLRRGDKVAPARFQWVFEQLG